MLFRSDTQAWDVMYAPPGGIGEKIFEYRDDSSYWYVRLVKKKFWLRPYRFVQFFRGYTSRSFTAEYVSHSIIVDRHMTVGPYSNGYSRKFSGDVWVVQVGKVVEETELQPSGPRRSARKPKHTPLTDTHDQRAESLQAENALLQIGRAHV